ncbi:hypothetical protein WJX72_001656 [[Myrmecia] bisecta]|uniref:Uncharacterized protein n=1 Tax=[Myrmecia] bisecta TaxID=41462 RepID=A0AAW1PXQ0_9CHLO
MPPKPPKHVEFEHIQFGDWRLDKVTKDQWGLPVVSHSKYPDYAAKILSSYGGKLIYEFSYDFLGRNRAKIEFNPKMVIGIERVIKPSPMVLLEVNSAPATHIGSQGTAGGPYSGRKTVSSYEVAQEDVSDGAVPASRYHLVAFKSAARVNSFIDSLVQLDPVRLGAALATGIARNADNTFFPPAPANRAAPALAAAATGAKRAKQGKPVLVATSFQPDETVAVDIAVRRIPVVARQLGPSRPVQKAKARAQDPGKLQEWAASRGWLGSDGAYCDGCRSGEDADDEEEDPFYEYALRPGIGQSSYSSGNMYMGP